MRVIGLTGSIGMGKSTTAAMFAARGIPVHDADATVKRLYAGPLVPAIRARFPEAVVGDAVDRVRLSAALTDPAALEALEAIVHPAVRAEEEDFLTQAKRSGARAALVDVPLLLETRPRSALDIVLVVTADAAVQRARVLARPGMTEEKFAAILARQMPDAEKRRRAHFLVDTGAGLDAADRAVADVCRAVAGMF